MNLFNTFFKALLISSILASIVLLAVSCGNEEGTAEPKLGIETSFFPAFEGLWWSYEGYDLDSNFTQINGPVYDSVRIEGSSNIEGYKAWHFVHYQRNAPEPYETEYKTMNSSFYMHRGSVMGSLPESWLMYGDMTKDNWTIFSDSVTNIAFVNGSKLTGRLKVNGAKGGQEPVQINSRQVVSQVFVIYTNFEGKILMPGNSSRKCNFNTSTTYYYGINIGLIKTYTPPARINVDSMHFYINGFEQTARKYPAYN